MRYSNWKGMKKSAKLILATSAVYAASTFALPVFANQTKENPVVQPINLDGITTVEQADKAYNERIKAYAEDKKITSQEITDLSDILERKKGILSEQAKVLEREINRLENEEWADTTGLYDEINIICSKLEDLNSKKIYESQELKEVKKGFNEKVLSYYPSLVEKDKNVFYSASDCIEQGLNPTMGQLILRADEILKKYYNDSTLELLTKKKEYTIKDVLTFYEVVNKKRKDVIFNAGEINPKKQKLEEKLQALRAKADRLEMKNDQEKNIRDQQISKLKKDIAENIFPKIRDLEKEDYPFTIYNSQNYEINRFINNNGDLNKYMSFSVYSVYMGGFLEDVNLGNKRRNFKSGNEKVVLELNDFFKSQGFDVEVEALKNPAKTMFPWPWWVNTLFGVAFPVFRNILTAKFIRREVDEFDVVEGFIEVVFFSILFDGAFPLMYPLRLFGMPLLIEPLRAATGGRDLK